MEVAALLVGMLAGFYCGMSWAVWHWEAEAITRGFAQYNPTTAEFEWKKL